MINPELKDKILIQLIEGGYKDQIIGSKTFDSDFDEISTILKQFLRRGFINLKDYSGLRFRVQVEVDAHDFIRRGGFKFEEEVYQNNFIKLEMELSKLEGEIPLEKFKNIMTLISTTAAAVSAYTIIGRS